MSSRIEDIGRGPRIGIEVDGRTLACFEGETIAAALLAARRPALRVDQDGRPRGAFCNMGTCSECFVALLGDAGAVRRVRACLTPVVPGLRIATGLPRHD